jgi:hypothetical protein
LGCVDEVVQFCDVADQEIATWSTPAGQGMTPGARRLAEDLAGRYGSTHARAVEPTEP